VAYAYPAEQTVDQKFRTEVGLVEGKILDKEVKVKHRKDLVVGFNVVGQHAGSKVIVNAHLGPVVDLKTEKYVVQQGRWRKVSNTNIA